MENRGTIGVIGLGYVGLPLCIAAAENDWRVIGYDTNAAVVESLARGESHIQDVNHEKIKANLSAGNLQFAQNLNDFGDVDICIICVPTPLDSDQKPDLSMLINAVKKVALYLNEKCILISESTSYPGTLRNIVIEEVNKVRKNKIEILGYVVAPERIDPGNSEFNYKNIPRVIAATNHESLEKAQNFYSSLGVSTFKASSPEVAELSKLLENSFRLVNISFINELVPYARKIGVNINEVIEAASTKPFGFMTFFPGPGIGGHCIPVDPQYLLDSAEQLDEKLGIIRRAFEVNASISTLISDEVDKLLSKNNSKNIILLGIAYKMGSKDTRETPAERIFNELISRGYNIVWDDEIVRDWSVGKKFINEQVALGIALNSATENLIRKYNNDIQILDCTGRFEHLKNVKSYFN